MSNTAFIDNSDFARRNYCRLYYDEMLTGVSKADTVTRIGSMVNLRDVGGYVTRDGGRVRTGLMYRSNELTDISTGDMEKIAALQLKYIYDLRTEDERTAGAVQLPPGAKYIVLDVLADSRKQIPPVQVRALVADPRSAQEALGGGKAAAMFKEYYRDTVSVASAKRAYSRLFNNMADPDKLPGLYYCRNGKDRSGWASIALLTLLGVPEDLVMHDYLLSNDYVIPKRQSLIDGFKEKGVDLEILMSLLGVWPDYLHAAFDEMRSNYGTIENYFACGLGIDNAMQQALRDIFVE